jgi:hypothetical protein
MDSGGVRTTFSRGKGGGGMLIVMPVVPSSDYALG